MIVYRFKPDKKVELEQYGTNIAIASKVGITKQTVSKIINSHVTTTQSTADCLSKCWGRKSRKYYFDKVER